MNQIRHQPKPPMLSLEALRALRIEDQRRKTREYQKAYRQGIRRRDKPTK